MHAVPRFFTPAVAVLVFVLASSLPSFAQRAVSKLDIQRLQDEVFHLAGDISRLRADEPGRADTLEAELDDLRDEVTYLRVRLNKEGRLPDDEYDDVRGRLRTLRSRVVDATSTSGRPGAAVGSAGRDREEQAARDRAGIVGDEIPVGQELDVRLERALSSETAQVEDRFTATTVVDLSKDGIVLIPAGSVVRGQVTHVQKATRLERKGNLMLSFDQITVRGETYPIRATLTHALESEGIRGEAGRIGTAASVGAIIGGILGGVRGALAGILIGGGGVVAATPGEDVTLPPGSVLRLRLDSPFVVDR